jgi:DNA polymerase III subunit beta
MKVQCAQDALAEALGAVTRAVSNRASLPILANVLLEASPSVGLRLVATNLDLMISKRIAATVSVERRVTLPARLLAEYVALLDKGRQVTLGLGSEASAKLHLICDRYTANLATLSADDFPLMVVGDAGISLDLEASAFRAAIEQVVFAAAPDDSRPVLAGVLLRQEGGTLTLAAADGYRLAVRTLALAQTNAPGAWVVPARTLVEVARSLPTTPGMPMTVTAGGGNTHMRFALGDTEIATRLIDGQFPDYERIIPRDAATAVILNTSDFLRATRAAAVFARDNSHIVHLECAPPPEDGTPALGRVVVASTSADLGSNAGQLDASVRGTRATIAFNGRYLRDALEALDSPQVSLQLSDGFKPGVLRPVGELEAAYRQVIMPMHVAR